MNSFNFIARGIDAEIERQIGVWESGGEVEQQTYDFDAATGTLTARRSKEEADDYRYFPEPDLVPVEPASELVDALAVGDSRVAGGADPPDRAGARPRARDRAGDRRARPSVGRDRGGGRRRRRGRERDREHAGGSGRGSGRRARGRAREARRGARPHPARSVRRGDLEARRAGLLRRPVSRAGVGSRTPTSSARSSTASSRRIPARSPRTAAARRGSSASSSAR